MERSELLAPLLRGIVIACAALLLGTGAAAAAKSAEQRPFRVDDLFELESIGRYYGGAFAFAPDGQRLAFTRVRPTKTLANYKRDFLWGNDGGDVWVQLRPGERPVNITNGIEDGSGWWAPQWSPDGSKLAMLSTRGGNVRLWVWDVATHQLRQLTTRGADLQDVRERAFLWVDSQRLLYPALPEGERPRGMKLELQTPMIATAAWPKAAKGDEVTASVLDSGVQPDLAGRERGDLLLLDVADGSAKLVAAGRTGSWQLAPNGGAVAFTREISVYTPKPNEPLPFDSSGTFTVEVATVRGEPIAVRGETSRDVFEKSLRWSPDGRELAFLGYAAGREESPVLYRLNVALGRITRLPLGGLYAAPIVREAVQLKWTAAGDLIVRAARRTGDDPPDVRARRDWWRIAQDGTQACLTAGMKAVPSELWPQTGRHAFIGLAGGELWRIEPAAVEVENLTAKFLPQIERLSWPVRDQMGIAEIPHAGSSYRQLIFAVRESGELEPHVLDLHSGEIRPIDEPAPGADLVAYTPVSGAGVFHASNRNGLFAWRGDVRADRHQELFATNGFLRNVAEGEFRSIEYTSLDGNPLKAWLILPVGYEEGKRYPLLTWVYAGSVAGPAPPSYFGIDSGSSLNLQIPAAHGYAVLIPSMPLGPEGAVDDPMLRLPDGVLPAVDKAIEMGIADPQRLFLMGQSFGGFSTYGLVTQTSRFTAAVSLAGLSNLISLYGQFDARFRYAAHPHENLFQAALMESAQVRMGGPPWQNLGRYLRNSPIFQVDRVQTPLMIVQGDLDYVAIQQGEEFFMSLYRQGKRARFVRYWGEGHVLRSPANIRDMWQRVFEWLEEFSPHS